MTKEQMNKAFEGFLSTKLFLKSYSIYPNTKKRYSLAEENYKPTN